MMLNYLAAALRNLARNRTIAIINVLGLTVGFAAALLIALYVRYELSYETFIPEHERIYRIASRVIVKGQAPETFEEIDPRVAEWLMLDFPEIESVARIKGMYYTAKRGSIEFGEQVFLADAEFFRMVPMTAIAGDLQTALDSPDGIVLNRRTAETYFGDENPLGQTIEIERVPMRVTAVLEDLPGNTHFLFNMVASSRAAFSPLKEVTVQSTEPLVLARAHTGTYLKLKPGASIESILENMPSFVQRRWQLHPNVVVEPQVDAIGDMHLLPAGRYPSMKPPANPQTLRTLTLISVLVVLIATINFVNLMTARASQRAIEVGVRKVAGATRRDLIVQFIGESLLYVVVAMVLSMAVVELVLPSFCSLLDAGDWRYGPPTIQFDYFENPSLLMSIVGIAMIIGILAGLYPALVLSSFRPVTVLQSARVSTPQSARIRQALVIAQFGILIGLIFATIVIYRQASFALNEGLKIDREQVLMFNSGRTANPTAFRQEVAALSGVADVTTSHITPTNYGRMLWPLRALDGSEVHINVSVVDFNFFEFYGLSPIAGRTFWPRRESDLVSFATPREASVVLNETSARRLGFRDPASAIDKVVTLAKAEGWPPHMSPPSGFRIVGVMPDFPVESVRTPIDPTLYFVDPTLLVRMSVRLKPDQIPQTLKAIDELWSRVGGSGALGRFFLDDYYRRLYLDLAEQRKVLGMLSLVAVFLAGLGLFGLSVFSTQRRTKEIGIRKVMGARRRDIVLLLVRASAKPVIWAAFLAVPIGAWMMKQWLNGFVYRVPLSATYAVFATAAAFLLAVLTVSVHSYKVARGKPADALRYE